MAWKSSSVRPRPGLPIDPQYRYRTLADNACTIPARSAFIQLDKVSSTTPRLPAADATLCPDSTSRTASCLNSSVCRPRLPFRILASRRY
jgi:hypothetical protein